MLTKKLAIFISVLTLFCCVVASQDTTPTKTNPAPKTKSATTSTDGSKNEDFYVSAKDYAEFLKLQSDLAQSVSAQGTGQKKCHIEYRNCWTDHETRCHPNPGGTVHCEQVPVRRCGKPETVCD
jgi:hypothetical protein